MRVTTVHGDPSRIDDVVALVREAAKPIVDSSPDGRGMSVFVSREEGRVVATSAWATEQARDESNEALAPVRRQAGRLMAGTVRTAEYEIAVSEQAVPPPAGAWMRATAIAGDPARLRDGIAEFQATIIPAMRRRPGFCGAGLIVDRATGRAVGSTIWSTRQAMWDTSSLSSGLRGDVAARAGGSITGVAEYEVVLAETAVQRYEHLFRRAYEIMSTGQTAELDELVAEDLVEHAPVPPGFPTGREGLKAFVKEYRTAFPDLRITMERYLEQGDTGCALVRATGTNTGSFMGQPPTGRPIDITMVDLVRVRDGRAVEHWGGSDDLGLLTQLGLAAPPIAIPSQSAQAIELEQKVKA